MSDLCTRDRSRSLSLPRADKITMSESLRSAFAHLQQVKTALGDIEALLSEAALAPPDAGKE